MKGVLLLLLLVLWGGVGHAQGLQLEATRADASDVVRVLRYQAPKQLIIGPRWRRRLRNFARGVRIDGQIRHYTRPIAADWSGRQALQILDRSGRQLRYEVPVLLEIHLVHGQRTVTNVSPPRWIQGSHARRSSRRVFLISISP